MVRNDVCRCVRAAPEGKCCACLCAFFCTGCMYHRLNSSNLKEYGEPIIPCTGACCKDLMCFAWVPCVAGGVAGALSQVPVAYQVATTLGYAASRLWQAYVSKEAHKRVETNAAHHYDYASFLFCLPCTYYNIIDDSETKARDFSHRNPILAPRPMFMTL